MSLKRVGEGSNVGTRVRGLIQAGATLATVVLVYCFPFVLSLLGTGAPGVQDVIGAPQRPEVFWMPPPPVSVDAGTGDEVLPSEQVATASAPEAIETDGVAEAEPLQVVTKRAQVRRKRVRRRPVAKGTAKRVRGKRAPRPPPTKKELRVKQRRSKRRERRAERKQCADLVDQIVMISETEVLFGREIVNCYRSHLEQFDALGGAAWAEEDGKHIGIRLRPSRRSAVPKAAGFKSGDIIKSVNGFRMRSMTGVGLAATQILRKKAKIKRIRDGELQVVIYRVVSLERVEEAKRELAALADAE